MLALEILEAVLYILCIGILCMGASYLMKKIEEFLDFLAKGGE